MRRVPTVFQWVSERMKKMTEIKSGGFVGGRKAALMVVLAAAISLTGKRSAASAPPVIGNEFGIGSVTVAAQYQQERPAIAAGGPGYLVVWHDRRSQTDYDIYGMFLDTNGNPVGSESFLISTTLSGSRPVSAPSDQIYPAVAFNGTYFLVVWMDKRAVNNLAHIYCARVTTSGQVLDPDGILVSGTTVEQSLPAVASNGTDFEVVWEENAAGGPDIYGARVTSAGLVTNRTGLSTRTDNERSPGIAWAGNRYIVVWEDYRSVEATGEEIYGCLVEATGQKVSYSEALISSAPGQPTTGAPGSQIMPRIARGSTGTCLVVWQDSRNADKDIYGARVTPGTSAVTVLDPGGIAINTATLDQEAPSVGWDGTYFLVGWRDKGFSRRIRGSRVTTGGAVLDTTPLNISSGMAGTAVQLGPSIAGSSGSSIVVWNTSGTTELDIRGARVTSSGSVGQDTLYSLAVQDQPTYAAAFDGENFVVVWSDRRSGIYTIYAARISKSGQVLDPGGVMIAAPTRDQTQPAIAWNGSSYLVVWTDGTGTSSDIKGFRIYPTLQPVDAAPFDICAAEQDQYAPSVAWNGSYFLVVWVDARYAVSPDYFTDIFGARVSSSGIVYPMSSAICQATNNQYAPSVTAGGSTWLVAWEDWRSGSPEIYGGRVSNAGSVLDGSGVQISTATANKYTPRVSWDGTNYLAVWADNRNGWTTDIFGVRLSPTLARLDANDISICTESGEQSAPSAVWTGENYFIAWQDYRNSSASDADIYYARMGSNGALLDGSSILVSAGVPGEMKPVVVSKGANSGCIFYNKFVYSLHRLAARVLSVPPLVPTIVAAKGLPDGSILSITGKWVTAGTNQLAGRIYIEEDDRSSGIKVVTSAAVQEGNMVDVAGVINTVGGERQIDAQWVNIVAPPPGRIFPTPVALGVAALGGARFNAYTPGVKYGAGLNNIGLLVRTWGRIVQVEPVTPPATPSWFIIRDGSVAFDALGLVPLEAKVVCPAGYTPPTVGSYVAVTGISSCEQVGADIIRRILPRKPADISVLQ